VTQDAVTSPCINICVIDECTGFCAGCLRTLDEIVDWGTQTDATRREILARVAARRELVRKTQQEHR
jgi:hypothetical protein